MLTIIGALRLRLQVMCGAEGAMGPGKAALLEAIRDYGSISAAGRHLNISYRRCWRLVDDMNRCWTEPLVEARRGGIGQGASITSTGETILQAYRGLEEELAVRARASPDYAVLAAFLRADPLVTAKPQPAEP